MDPNTPEMNFTGYVNNLRFVTTEILITAIDCCCNFTQSHFAVNTVESRDTCFCQALQQLLFRFHGGKALLCLLVSSINSSMDTTKRYWKKEGRTEWSNNTESEEEEDGVREKMAGSGLQDGDSLNR